MGVWGEWMCGGVREWMCGGVGGVDVWGCEDGEDEFMCTVCMHRFIPRFPFPVFVFCNNLIVGELGMRLCLDTCW